MATSLCFPLFFTKGNNFCDFSFAYLDNKVLPKWGLHLEEKKFFKRAIFFHLVLIPIENGSRNENNRVTSHGNMPIFSSPEHKVLKVSYCDHPVSGVRRQSSVVCCPSCVVNNSFKAHLLLNYWTNFKIILHKCSPETPLPKLLKWFRSAEQNGHQS